MFVQYCKTDDKQSWKDFIEQCLKQFAEKYQLPVKKIILYDGQAHDYNGPIPIEFSKQQFLQKNLAIEFDEALLPEGFHF